MQSPPDNSDKVPLEAAKRLLVGLAVRALLRQIYAGRRVKAGPSENDLMKRCVQLAAAKAREPVAANKTGINRDESMTDLAFDEASQRALAAMRSPIGGLEGNIPQGLVDKVNSLRVLRNKVAHEILLLWRVETKLALVDHTAVAQGMFQTAQRFEHCRAKINALAERHLRNPGIDLAEMQLDLLG